MVTTKNKIMIKTFSLVTEYTEQELITLIETSVREVLLQTQSHNLITSGNSPPISTEINLLSRTEVCKMLQITLPTLTKLQKSGKLKYIIILGSYRYDMNDIHNFIKSNKGR